MASEKRNRSFFINSLTENFPVVLEKATVIELRRLHKIVSRIEKRKPIYISNRKSTKTSPVSVATRKKRDIKHADTPNIFVSNSTDLLAHKSEPWRFPYEFVC